MFLGLTWTETKDAGIDTGKFTAHSTRAASTSAAAQAGTLIEVIMESAGWSNCGTFAKFYHKPIRVPCNFGSVQLKANTLCPTYLLFCVFVHDHRALRSHVVPL